jgi:hypothetical protein
MVDRLSKICVYKKYVLYKIISQAAHFRPLARTNLSSVESPMVRGRPKGDEPTCVLAVRVSIALREQLDRYLAALETRIGLKASRNEIIRHALRRFLEAQQGEAWPAPPQGFREL